MKCNEVNGVCKCDNKMIIEKLNSIEEQVKVLTEEYDLLNRYVYEASDDIEYRSDY